MKRLLRQKPFNQITIEDLSKESGVCRSTFYYHFHNTYELIEWSLMRTFTLNMEGRYMPSVWQGGFLSFLNSLYNDKDYLLNVYPYVGHERLCASMTTNAKWIIRQIVSEVSTPFHVTETQKDYITMFYSVTFVGLILDWISSGMVQEPKELSQNWGLIADGCLVGALKAYDSYNREHPEALSSQ